VPVAAAWMAVALMLGKTQERLAAQTPNSRH